MDPKKLLSELKQHDKEKYEIVTKLRTIILDQKNNPTEEVKYGGLLYSDPKPYTGLFVSKKHVSMEFSNGAQFTDPNKVLKGTGKFRRHLVFTSKEDIDKKIVTNFLKQAVKAT